MARYIRKLDVAHGGPREAVANNPAQGYTSASQVLFDQSACENTIARAMRNDSRLFDVLISNPA